MNVNYVLITGASRGLGRAIAVKLYSLGYSLLLHASRPESLTPLLDELEDPSRYSILCADFCIPEDIRSFCKDLKKNYKGRLSTVVNNAGIVIDKPLVYQPESDIDRILAVNLKAPIMIAKTAMKMFMLSGTGTIINMGSVIGETGNAFQSVYAATKAGLTAASRSLAQETRKISADSNVRVLSVAPGFIDTDMTSQIQEDIRAEYIDRIPLGRMGKAEEVAALIAFLLSKEASYINGSCLNINGGLI